MHIGSSRYLQVLLALPFLVAGLGCEMSVPQASRLRHVRVADIPLVTQAPFYVAFDKGYFRDEGLDVELVPSTTTSEAVELLTTNQVDLAAFGPDPAVFNTMDRGIGIKMLASAAVFSAGTRASGLVVRQDLIDSGQYRGPADLKGRTIAVSAAQSQFYAELTLARDALKASDVSFTTVANAEMVPALSNGAVDAAWEVEPLIGALQQQHIGTLVATGLEALPGGIPWIVFESATFAQADLVTRTAFMRAYLRGLRDFYHAFNRNDGPRAPVVAALAAHSSVHDSTVLERIGMHTVDPDAALDLAILDRYQDYYLETGNQLRRVDLHGVVDPVPLSAALSALGQS
jgi:NitT/TauT family transport system substrate-binding protein